MTTISDVTFSPEIAEGVDLDRAKEAGRRKLLVIDDEPDTVTLLKHILIREGFDVAGAANGREAINKMNEVQPSLILLDMMMPEMDGWQTIDKIQEISDVPIIILSAMNQSDSIIRALQMGADDYITKPFNQAEVVARIGSVLRRSGGSKKMARIGVESIGLVLDLDTHEAYLNEKSIQLTGKMFEVLHMLIQSAPRLVPYQELTEKIWGKDSPAIRNRLKYLVYLLRQEFEKVGAQVNVIDNIGRLGYKLNSR
jgi:two-component system, OmpR family, response regulator MprA